MAHPDSLFSPSVKQTYFKTAIRLKVSGKKYGKNLPSLLSRLFVIAAHDETSVINLSELTGVFGKICSVAISHGVRAPFFGYYFGSFYETFVRRYGKSSFTHFFFSFETDMILPFPNGKADGYKLS